MIRLYNIHITNPCARLEKNQNTKEKLMENEQNITDTRKFLDELKQKLPPEELEEFSTELYLALHVFFHGRMTHNHNIITYRIPKGPKFRITVDLIK